MHHTEVRSGDGHQNPNIQISRYPDIQISRYPDIQMSRCPDIQISGIRYQISGIRYQKKYVKITPSRFFRKVKNKFQRIGQIEAMTPQTPPETQFCIIVNFGGVFGKLVFGMKFRAGLGGQANLFGKDSYGDGRLIIGLDQYLASGRYRRGENNFRFRGDPKKTKQTFLPPNGSISNITG